MLFPLNSIYVIWISVFLRHLEESIIAKPIQMVIYNGDRDPEKKIIDLNCWFPAFFPALGSEIVLFC
jgi:hypothetical protein